jgi:DNA-binding NarL/FixJ family response regulator
MVTDVGLPNMNGRQLAEIARELRPDLRILYIIHDWLRREVGRAKRILAPNAADDQAVLG